MRSQSFLGSHIIFATNHGKAEAARAPFQEILSAQVDELTINSDALGTFSGEVERPGSMLDALRGKIHMAAALTSAPLILASEGSFSSANPFALPNHGIEMLMLFDSRAGVEIIEQHISYDTNYATGTLRSLSELHAFLERISFSTHALVLFPDGLPLLGNVRKGLTEVADAERAFMEALSRSPSQSVTAMSDMRAHVNPTRMRAIRACCELLANRLATACPRCCSGGFGLTATAPGLVCSECGAPTQRARGEIHSCPFCCLQKELPRADGRTVASPAECEWCNP